MCPLTRNCNASILPFWSRELRHTHTTHKCPLECAKAAPPAATRVVWHTIVSLSLGLVRCLCCISYKSPIACSAAYLRADAHGDGVVFIDNIAHAFRARAHPEVMEGSREEDDVRREFLESFSGRSINGTKFATRLFGTQDPNIWLSENIGDRHAKRDTGRCTGGMVGKTTGRLPMLCCVKDDLPAYFITDYVQHDEEILR